MILWVDDDINYTLKPYVDDLGCAGYRVLTATNPESMQQQLAEHIGDIDLIIMDAMMPLGDTISPDEGEMGMSTGLVLLSSLQADPGLSEIPIILLSVRDDEEIAEWARKAGIPYYLKLDTPPSELLRIVGDVLGAEARQ
ncbi:MAG: response regulator [Deferrisomatales bacterium]